MRVCVKLDMIWLDVLSRRLWPLEDGEGCHLEIVLPLPKGWPTSYSTTAAMVGDKEGTVATQIRSGSIRTGCRAPRCLRRSVTSRWPLAVNASCRPIPHQFLDREDLFGTDECRQTSRSSRFGAAVSDSGIQLRAEMTKSVLSDA